jgi:glutathione S-transferase
MAKLYGAAQSTCTQRVLATAHELGMDLELVPVDMKSAGHKSAEHVKRQPFGQVLASLTDPIPVLTGP